MKKIIRYSTIGLICFTGLLSCKDEAKEVEVEKAPLENAIKETSKTTDSTTARLNPEHGMPGHRCEIPVGAPLDQAAVAPTTTSTTSPLLRADAQPKKNPPHGQPGHDCSKPVGADL